MLSKHREKAKAAKGLLLCTVVLLTFVIVLAFGRTVLSEWITAQFCSFPAVPPATADPAAALPLALASDKQTPHVFPDLVLYETLLTATYKNCLGKYCMDGEFKDSLGKPLTRVGLLAPDERFHGLAQVLMVLHAISDSKDQIEIVPSTHVPPYGYGRNHGLSRIIRLADNSLPLQAYRLIADHVDADGAAMVYEAQVRQLMRWHCRLNHVAAHSAMLTVFTEDLLLRPEVELQRMASFIGIKVREDDVRGAIARTIRSLPSPSGPPPAAPPVLMNWQRIAADTIRDELVLSRNLSTWPCKSFKDLESKQHKGEVLLPHRRYYMLSPNCSAPFVKCSVQYDFREQKV